MLRVFSDLDEICICIKVYVEINGLLNVDPSFVYAFRMLELPLYNVPTFAFIQIGNFRTDLSNVPVVPCSVQFFVSIGSYNNVIGNARPKPKIFLLFVSLLSFVVLIFFPATKKNYN